MCCIKEGGTSFKVKKMNNIKCQKLVQICELTRIERVLPGFRDSHPPENLNFTSPALPIFHPHSSSKKYPRPQKNKKQKQNKTRKNKNKVLFKEEKAPGKTPLYQRSLEHLTTLCMTSVYFHFFFLCLCIISSSIVYNRGARLALACFGTPSWW